MNSLSVKAKFQIGKFKSLKQIFCMLEGQFDLEGQDHKCFKKWKAFRSSIHRSRLKVKFILFQKLLHSQGITQNF